MKRKRKEHRSLDSILFEDDGELEYFDVLNLLPLSNVRLEFDEEDARHNNFARRNAASPVAVRHKALQYLESKRHNAKACARSNATDEEKCKKNTEIGGEDCHDTRESDSLQEFREDSSPEQVREEPLRDKSIDRRSTSSKTDEDSVDGVTVSCDEQVDRQVEETEDYKSIWISDTEEQEDMSRRPQVLKVVDNDVTKRRHRQSSAEIDRVIGEPPRGGKLREGKEVKDRFRKAVEVDGASRNSEVSLKRESIICGLMVDELDLSPREILKKKRPLFQMWYSKNSHTPQS